MFDAEATNALLQKTLAFLKESSSQGKIILFVSSRHETMDIIHSAAEKLSMPYVIGRWIGGIITNFDTIKKRLKRLQTLRQEKSDGTWSGFTKKENILLERELQKLEEKFSGLVSLTKKPDVLFVLDSHKESIAVEEARNAGITVVAFSNANADITKVDHLILGNIGSRESVRYIMKQVFGAINKANGK